MAPNLLLKAGFVRGVLDSKEEVTKCRTDFILQNVYYHQLKNLCDVFEPLPAKNSKEEKVLMLYKSLIAEFRDSYASDIKFMVKKVEKISADVLPELVRSVSAELFSQGFSWCRMIGFFVFVGELALEQVPKDNSGNVINRIYESFCKHVKETLMSWVDDNGGWEGVESVAIKRDTATTIDAPPSSDLNTSKSPNESWYLNVATGAFRVVGTLFQLAAPHVHSYS